MQVQYWSNKYVYTLANGDVLYTPSSDKRLKFTFFATGQITYRLMSTKPGTVEKILLETPKVQEANTARYGVYSPGAEPAFFEFENTSGSSLTINLNYCEGERV